MNIPGYDAWKLSGPEEHTAPGIEEGQPCLRLPEPDEDQPRGFRPKPCSGTMTVEGGYLACDKCGETV